MAHAPHLNSTGLFFIAHAPFASALKTCALHTFAEQAHLITTFDVTLDTTIENGLPLCLDLTKKLKTTQILIITDVIGATPYNLGKKLMETLVNMPTFSKPIGLLSGANVPMLLRTLTYNHEPLEKLIDLAISGATNGIVHVGSESL